MAKGRDLYSLVSHSVQEYHVAWCKLYDLLKLIRDAGCESISCAGVLSLLAVLVEGGNDGRHRSVVNGLCAIYAVVGDGVIGYFDGAGRLIGFSDLKEVSKEESSAMFERSEQCVEILTDGGVI